jgi:hypothetical protein
MAYRKPVFDRLFTCACVMWCIESTAQIHFSILTFHQSSDTDPAPTTNKAMNRTANAIEDQILCTSSFPMFSLHLTLLFIDMAPAAFPNLPQDMLDTLNALAIRDKGVAIPRC